jgi:prepilin-type N-terminal cleavage/methylation domain-containing protein
VRTNRRGYTLFEVIVVLALLLLLAAVVLPSIGAFQGDTRQRAASDAIRAEIAIARSHAMEEGIPYRVAISEDGTRIRRAPDNEDFASVTGATGSSASSKVSEYQLENVKAEVTEVQGGMPPGAENGWVTLAIVLPNGTCRDDGVFIAIRDEEKSPLYVYVRGLTGSSRVVTNPNGASR